MSSRTSMALLPPACASFAKLTEPLLMAVLVVVWAAPAAGAALALGDDAVLVAARFGAMLQWLLQSQHELAVILRPVPNNLNG